MDPDNFRGPSHGYISSKCKKIKSNRAIVFELCAQTDKQLNALPSNSPLAARVILKGTSLILHLPKEIKFSHFPN